MHEPLWLKQKRCWIKTGGRWYLYLVKKKKTNILGQETEKKIRVHCIQAVSFLNLIYSYNFETNCEIKVSETRLLGDDDIQYTKNQFVCIPVENTSNIKTFVHLKKKSIFSLKTHK